ncbi:YggS family pyridoxal phosphate-dependent enzyme [Desulfatiferula olefinivorans]
MSPDQTLGERIRTIRQRIDQAARACGRDPETVRLVAVSKTKPAEAVRRAAAEGQIIFGENYIQEAADKLESLRDLDISFHFIGHLQSNKARFAVAMFDLIHSVDSLKLAEAIDRQAAKINKIQPILIQVNISMEDSKSGVSETDAVDLVRAVSRLDHVSIRGLMTLPPFYDEPDRVRPYFHALRNLAERIRALSLPTVRMDELSMGMSGDFEAAIAEGATLVRIGTALFGERS